ncbi:hypothetical protein HET73_07300 [Wolbachia endosymbiont of Atemnus politus]|uniref:ankyrin repeat domain-containing protein n=1 Tax=Wolbachia endosymbiont of Atemnus politus TaxID=2682840 RepID=UPI0015716958|nr:hypothetical protein [Wolbachia endosymbiont of Atemnus politus]
MANALSKVEGIGVNAVQGGSSLGTPLHVAAEFNSEKVIDVLLRAGEINVNARDCVIYTPLHWAAFHNSKKAIDALLKAEDIDVNLINKNSETPLHCAARFGSEGAISALLKAKDIDVNAKDKDSKTPLLLTVSDWNNEEALNILIGEADVKVVDKDGNTPLHLVALNDDDGKFVQALIKRGANVNAENQDRCTPLHLGAEHGHTDILNAIIQNRANVKVVNVKMEVPLYIWLLHVIAKKKL